MDNNDDDDDDGRDDDDAEHNMKRKCILPSTSCYSFEIQLNF